MLKIVIDAMGADNGVLPIVDGVKKALSNKDFKAILVGNEALIKPLVDHNTSERLMSKIEIVHTQDYIKMNESASTATKRKESSIYVGIEIVRNNQADAIVSAGHSGATMGLATLRIGRIEGVGRPAICTLMPSITPNPSMILDAGANTDCKPEYLVDFAIMGYEYAKNVMGYKTPRVGILANGEEDSKGNELTKEAFKSLKKYNFFKGNVEGNDIFNGSVDVIVCDGFSGNIVLKASEGIASSISYILKQEIKTSILSILGGMLLKGAFRQLKKKTDYAEYGGAPLLGVNKTVIISHGKSNARAIECAIYQAIKAIESNVCEKIAQAFVGRIAK